MTLAFWIPICLLSLVVSSSLVAAENREAIEDGHTDLYFEHLAAGQVLQSKNIENEVIYQVVVDRFYNGNPANDCVYGGRYCASPGHPFPWYNYYGGDIRGLIEKTDYLKDLGVTRLWMTPIFENAPVRVETTSHGRPIVATSYHGYWIRDWFRLNPYFTDKGSKDFEPLRTLVERAYPEIRLYLDTVANHTSPANATEESLQFAEEQRPLVGTNGRSHRGAIFRDGEYVSGMDEDEFLARTHNDHVRFFNPYDRKIVNWDNQWEVENFQLDRLSDLNQESVEVRRYMMDAHRFWLDQFPKLAGYRMDTIKHVPQEYWREFSSDLYSSHPQVEVFGEYWGAGPKYRPSHKFSTETRMTMLDFEFRDALLAAFGPEGQPFEIIVDVWRNDPALLDARNLITFIDSHDFPRARGLGLSMVRMKQALATLMISRGVPCLYYGIEQDLHVPGDPGDPYNRPMMNSFDQMSEMFVFTKQLIAIRKQIEAIRYGSTHVVHNSHHILAVERLWKDQTVFFAISKNPRQGSDDFYIINLQMPDGVYRDRFSQKFYEVKNGRVYVELSDGDMILFTSEDRLLD